MTSRAKGKCRKAICPLLRAGGTKMAGGGVNDRDAEKVFLPSLPLSLPLPSP